MKKIFLFTLIILMGFTFNVVTATSVGYIEITSLVNEDFEDSTAEFKQVFGINSDWSMISNGDFSETTTNYNVKNVYFDQLLTNGNFVDNVLPSNYSSVNTIFSLNNEMLTLTKYDNDLQYNGFTLSSVVKPNHKTYISMDVTNFPSVFYYFMFYSYSSVEGYESFYQDYNIKDNYSFILETNNTYTNEYLTLYFYMRGDVGVWDFSIDNFMFYDLTEIFGAGNEPSLEEFEKILKFYTNYDLLYNNWWNLDNVSINYVDEINVDIHQVVADGFYYIVDNLVYNIYGKQFINGNMINKKHGYLTIKPFDFEYDIGDKFYFQVDVESTTGYINMNVRDDSGYYNVFNDVNGKYYNVFDVTNNLLDFIFADYNNLMDSYFNIDNLLILNLSKIYYDRMPLISNITWNHDKYDYVTVGQSFIDNYVLFNGLEDYDNYVFFDESIYNNRQWTYDVVNSNIRKNDLFYLRFDASVFNEDLGSTYIDYEINNQNFSLQNANMQTFSMYDTAVADGLYRMYIGNVGNSYISPFNYDMLMDNLMIINLSDIFGRGNEPSIDEFESMLINAGCYDNFNVCDFGQQVTTLFFDEWITEYNSDGTELWFNNLSWDNATIGQYGVGVDFDIYIYSNQNCDTECYTSVGDGPYTELEYINKLYQFYYTYTDSDGEEVFVTKQLVQYPNAPNWYKISFDSWDKTLIKRILFDRKQSFSSYTNADDRIGIIVNTSFDVLNEPPELYYIFSANSYYDVNVNGIYVNSEVWFNGTTYVDDTSNPYADEQNFWYLLNLYNTDGYRIGNTYKLDELKLIAKDGYAENIIYNDSINKYYELLHVGRDVRQFEFIIGFDKTQWIDTQLMHGLYDVRVYEFNLFATQNVDIYDAFDYDIENIEDISIDTSYICEDSNFRCFIVSAFSTIISDNDTLKGIDNTIGIIYDTKDFAITIIKSLDGVLLNIIVGIGGTLVFYKFLFK